MVDNSKLEALKRRVELDPASIAFAQLAEEYRRAGRFQEAVDCSRAGLKVHPGYLSARVTLGRALLQLDNLDEAQRELEAVLAQTPDNAAALRGAAEIDRRRGNLVRSLERYRAALKVTRYDSELEHAVLELSRQLAAQNQDDGWDAAASQEPEAAFAESIPAPRRTIESTIDERVLMRALRTMGALEEWLSACHVARAQRRAS